MLSQFSNTISVPTAIAIIKEIEEAYPTWTTAQVIDNLSFVASLNSPLSQVLFGSDTGATFLPREKLTQIDLDSLIDTINQKTYDNDGLCEIGISLDPSTGRKVALGHVISGISAALYDPDRSANRTIDSRFIDLLRGVKFSIPVLNMDGILAPPDGSPTTFELSPTVVAIDSLYAMTIAGDIARTITGNEQLWTEELYPLDIGGIGTEASSAELYGNIDGFGIGTWLLRTDKGRDISMRMNLSINAPNNVKLSTILGEYYGIIKTENRVINMMTIFQTKLISNLRFSNFLGLLKSTDFRLNILTQSIVYQLVNSQLDDINNCSFENTIKAYVAFEGWCISEFSKLRNASILSKDTGMSFVDCIDEYNDLSYLNLQNYFISQSDNSDPLVEDFIAYYPKNNIDNRLLSSYL